MSTPGSSRTCVGEGLDLLAVVDREADRDHRLQRAAERGEVDLGVEAAQHAAARAARARAARRSTGATPTRSASRLFGIRASSRECLEDRAVDVVEAQVVRHGGDRRRSAEDRAVLRRIPKILRFTGGLPHRCFTERMQPAVHAPRPTSSDSILDAIGDTPLVRLSRLGAGLTPQLVAKVEALNPGGSIKDRVGRRDDRGRRARRRSCARRHDRRADVGQHRHRPGHRRAAEGLPRDRGDAGQDVARRRSTSCAPTAPRSSSARPTSRPTRPSPTTGRRPPGRRDPRRLPAQPVLQPGQPAGPLRLHRPRDLGADRRPDHAPRRRRRHRRHDHRHRRATSRSATRTSRSSAPTRSARSTRRPTTRSSPYLVEGVGEDFWPETFDPSIVDR